MASIETLSLTSSQGNAGKNNERNKNQIQGKSFL